jgi:hypothetical protein
MTRRILTAREQVAMQAPWRTAALYEEPPEMPHDDWHVLPNYSNADRRDDLTPGQKSQVYHEWHPHHGESFVQYLIFPPTEPGGHWRAEHNGINQGMDSGTTDSGHDYVINQYDFDQWDDIGTFPTPEEGRRAVEQYHSRRYGQPPRHEYDIDQIMREHGGQPTQQRRGPGDEEDFGDIFGGSGGSH